MTINICIATTRYQSHDPQAAPRLAWSAMQIKSVCACDELGSDLKIQTPGITSELGSPHSAHPQIWIFKQDTGPTAAVP